MVISMERTLLILAMTLLFWHNVMSQQCPSKEELDSLRESLDGSIIFPGEKDYWEAGEMKATNYNSDFNFILYAVSQDDVKKFVVFVRRFGMRPTVRSSGHDYTGRSGGDNTCNLSFEKFKERTVNLSDSESSTGASMTVSSGNAWIDVYKEADRAGKIVLGGSAHTVAMGGYFQGGGHSPLSRKLGLGVDQVISFSMVTVDGDAINVDKTGYTFENGTKVSDPEVFRSVMGGGGGVYGFVTYFRLKLHDPPSDGFVGLAVDFALTTPLYNFSDIVVAKYCEMFLDMGENWGGFMLTRPGSILPQIYMGTVSLYMLHWGGYSGAKPFIDEIKEFRPDLNPTITVTNYSTFYEYEEKIVDPTGFRTVIANRILHRSDLESNQNFQKLVGTSLDYGIDIACTGVLMGHATAVPNPATSVSTQFRNGLMSLSCGTGWGEADQDKYFQERFQKFIDQRLYLIGEGTYYNEPDRNLPDWKTAYWGTMENYNRLLAVKKQLDPQNVLWCRNCVGSDEVSFTTPCPSGISSAQALGPIAAVVFLLPLFSTIY